MTKADKILKEEIADEIKVQKLFAELANVIDEKHSIELAIDYLVKKPAKEEEENDK